MSSLHRRGNVLAAHPAILFIAAALQAVAAGATAGPADANADAALQEVIVTASLRRDRLAELPASVSVLDAATVRGAGVQHLQDLLPLVPNLNWASGSSRPR
ncbi:MAG: hypothetical protein IT481_09415, partial [Gammaproteobacteria bacterium]|nr:hypothetical protein [Gammaproteobacteria bacterium]